MRSMGYTFLRICFILGRRSQMRQRRSLRTCCLRCHGGNLPARSHLVQARDVVGKEVAHDKPNSKAFPARRTGLIPPPELGQHLRDPPTLYG